MRASTVEARLRTWTQGKKHRHPTAHVLQLSVGAPPDALPALQVRPLADQREAQLWREYVDRYHYLGYAPLAGAQQRYVVTSQQRVLAVAGFGASAWKAAPRDRFIRSLMVTKVPTLTGIENRSANSSAVR